MSNNRTTLVCKGVIYYSWLDEDLFFDGLKKITCIEDMEGVLDKLYLYLSSPIVSPEDFRNLKGIFRRYLIDIEQLSKLTVKKDDTPKVCPDDIDEGDPNAE